MIVNLLRRNVIIRNAYAIFILFTYEFALSNLKNIFWYIGNYSTIKKIRNENFNNFKLAPQLNDKTSFTPIEPVYFYQDTWAARKIFELKPKHHYDVGSSAKTLGILSQFVPITMIDIRPLPLDLPGLNFIEGSILDLPFDDNSLGSISSLCVVEHIGLGRYGDPIDAFGSEKSILELKRVVRVGGVIIFSVPVDIVNTVYFNAHRAFTRDYILTLFDGFELLEEKYQYDYELVEDFDADRGFGTGLFMFRKLGNNNRHIA
jgi:SAM-dependent methyltransferase